MFRTFLNFGRNAFLLFECTDTCSASNVVYNAVANSPVKLLFVNRDLTCFFLWSVFLSVLSIYFPVSCHVIPVLLLFSPLGKLATRLYILLALISFLFFLFLSFFNDRSENKLSHDLLDRFSQSFHRMKAFWVQIIDLDLFLRYLKGRCRGNQFCGKMANSSLLLCSYDFRFAKKFHWFVNCDAVE